LPKGLPPHREFDGPIAELIEGSQPHKKHAFKLSPWENDEIKKQLLEYIEKGFLGPTTSQWGAPVF
jgi:hypothetical protein